MGPRSAKLIKRERSIFPRYYYSDETKLGRFVVARAKGSYIYDVDGNRYVDLSSQWATNNIGNVHPELIGPVCEALERYGFIIYSLHPHVPLYELAEKLIEIAPSERLKRVVFDATGTGAVEVAYKFAVVSKKRPYILGFYGQYHGVSLGGVIMSAIQSESKKHLEHLQSGMLYAPYPYGYRAPFDATVEEYAEWILSYIEDYLLRYIAEPDRIAGILFEPVLAEGGVLIPPRNFIEGLRKLSEKYNWFLIADEVESGFGRTGKMFAIEHFNIDVDLMPLAKGLTGGLLPVAATLGSDEAMDVSVETGTTFAGHPAACVAAKINIEIMLRDRLPERAAKLGEEALKSMEDWTERFKYVGEVRGIGLLIGVEFVKDKKTKEPYQEFSRLVFMESMKRGVIPLWDSDTWCIRIEPPLNIDEELLMSSIETIGEAIKAAERRV